MYICTLYDSGFGDGFLAVDCQVSDWGDYSECSAACGIGVKTRERRIEVEPRFGGAPCPQNLRQQTVCAGTNCSETTVQVKKEIEKGE